MRIGLITYNAPHLKTEQVLLRIAGLPHEFEVFALPFTPRKERSISFHHRPDQSLSVPTKELAEKYKLPFVACGADTDIPQGRDLYLVLGAGIISPEAVRGKRIINCHPGIIPISRGLDAFKWSIYHGEPLGITLHYIDEAVDAGEVISIVPTPVFPSDSLETLARRHYENEIDCLSNFSFHLQHPRNDFTSAEAKEARRRMPNTLEQELPARLAHYLNQYC